MHQHEPDWLSGAFGTLFAFIGLIFLTTQIRWERFDGAVFAWIGLIVVGVAILGTTVRRLRIED